MIDGDTYNRYLEQLKADTSSALGGATDMELPKLITKGSQEEATMLAKLQQGNIQDPQLEKLDQIEATAKEQFEAQKQVADLLKWGFELLAGKPQSETVELVF